LSEIKTDIVESKTKISELATAEILTEVKSVKSLVEAIPAPKDDSAIDSQILSEVILVKGLVEKSAANGVPDVEENDKGVEVAPKKVEGNGVKVDAVEVTPEA
jgi:hypothetical protein